MRTSKASILARKREEDAIRLRLEGLTLEEIAKRLGYSNRSSVLVAIIRARSRLCPIPQIEELRNREVASTYEIEREAWEQWFRSMENKKSETVKESAVDTGQNGDALKVETQKKTEGQCGNPAYLEKILMAQARRARLLGIDKPLKIDWEHKGRVIGAQRIKMMEVALKEMKRRMAEENGHRGG